MMSSEASLMGNHSSHLYVSHESYMIPQYMQQVAAPCTSHNGVMQYPDIYPMPSNYNPLHEQFMQTIPPCDQVMPPLELRFCSPPSSINQSTKMPPNCVLPPRDLSFSSPPPPYSVNSSSLNPSAVDSSQHISHVLQCYQQGGEDSEFVRKAIESLVKKVKDKREELDSLITAVTSAGKQHSGCVTIQRSLDGRLQVAGRKGVPHVVYARIWRWPNVNKNELVKLPICAIPGDHQDFICINPYHYERVVSNGIAPLDMKSLRIDPPESTKAEYPTHDYTEMTTSTEAALSGNYGKWAPCPMNQGDNNFNVPSFQDAPQANRSSVSGFDDLSQVELPPIAQKLPQNWCTISYHELDSPVGETFKAPSDVMQRIVSVDGGMDPHGHRHGRFCLGAVPNVHRGEASDKCRLHIGGGIQLQCCDDGTVFLKVHSLKPVFIRSGYLDYCLGVPYGSKVHRFTVDNGSTTIFDLRWAYREMVARTNTASEAMRAQAAAVAGISHGAQVSNLSDVMADSGVDGMRSAFCTMQLSFLKGWGTGYPRNSVKETPCWIEIQLHRPLQLLNSLLKSTA